MQIPLLSGVSASQSADFNLSLPVNLEGVAIQSGLSKGYLRSASGANLFGTGPGIGRGGILWENMLYRVMGTKLVSVSSSGTVTTLGDVGGSGPVSLTYGFGRLAIRSGTSLYYWDAAALTQVTDPDLGQCLDAVWFKGQYFSTDGTYIVALQISDPTAVDPLKYGAAEQDPDPLTGLAVVRNELLACGTNSIEFFDYVGGTGFPLQVNEGATIPVGVVGASAKALFAQTLAFVGSGRNQALAVWAAASGTAAKLSTDIIDRYLSDETNPAAIEVEVRTSLDEERLFIHLTDKTLVYLRMASEKAGEPVWYIAQSGQAMDQPYRLRHAVLANNHWIVDDLATAKLGVLSDSEATHFGDAVGWRFDTRLLYNGAKGAIVHDLELVCLPGRAPIGEAPTAFLSFSLDGENWSVERATRLGIAGQRQKRTQWRPHKRFANYMTCRFRGDSSSLQGIAALEATLEGLST